MHNNIYMCVEKGEDYMKLNDIIEKFPEENRKEVEKTIDACMRSINCEEVDWKEFAVYDSSCELLQKILQNLAIEFLMPIAEKAREEKERKVIIFCNEAKKEDDEIWFVRVNSTDLHATITLSSETIKYISRQEE